MYMGKKKKERVKESEKRKCFECTGKQKEMNYHGTKNSAIRNHVLRIRLKKLCSYLCPCMLPLPESFCKHFYNKRIQCHRNPISYIISDIAIAQLDRRSSPSLSISK